MSFTKNQLITIAVGAIIVAVVFFLIGNAHGKSAATKARTTARAGMTGGAGGFTRGGAAGGGFANGTIVSKDATSITVQMQTGSKIVWITSSTPVMKSTAGTLSDLSVGQNITVTGTANSDGSLTAQSVSIRPAGMTGTGMGGTAGTNPAAPAPTTAQ